MSSENASLGTVIAEFEKKTGYKDYKKIIVCVLNQQERIIGEAKLYNEATGFFDVLNPRSYLRLMRVVGTGIQVDNFVGDFDLIEKDGLISVKPVAFYYLHDQDEKTQKDMMELFDNYFERRNANAAVSAGLVVPDQRLVRKG